MNPELLDYLKTMITPGEAQGVPDAVFLHVVAGQGFDWSAFSDQSVHAIVMEGSMDAQADIEQAFRTLKPGGHLMLQNPEDEPTGFTGACLAEDVGFEVRDCILVPDQAGDGDRLHYVAKASRGEREEGLSEQVVSPSLPDVEDEEGDEVGPKGKKRFNSHPTVKPKAVMERLLMDVPKDRGPVVDPFLGSGTTGIACVATGHDFIGIEREQEYMKIADARIRHWATKIAGWNAPEVVSDLSEIPVGAAVEETPVEAKPVTVVLTFEDLF